MSTILDSLVKILSNERYLIILILIIVLIIYFYEIYKYYNLFKKSSNYIHLAPISIKGKISKWIDPEEMGLVVREQLFVITDNFRRAQTGHSVP